MPRRGKRRKIADGIYADRSGVACVARAGHLSREQRYDRGTSIKIMRSWQRDTVRELRKLLGTPAADRRRTLAEDVTVYLALVAEELASIKDRTRDAHAWLPRFGHRRRYTLKTRELDAQLRHWRNVDGLSPSSVNHRRDALSDLFQVLDGKEAPNPVKGCVWFARTKSVPQGIDRGRIARVLAAMDPAYKTRWRLTLMHWTGMRPSQMGRLRPTGEDFYLDERAFQLEINNELRRVPAILVPSGKGGDPVMFPLTAEGEVAAGAFLRVKAFGKWSCPSAYKRIVQAAAAAGETAFNVYAIKHSFASALRRTGTDLADIQDMLGHADLASTRVYAPTVNAKHVQALDRLRADDARREEPSNNHHNNSGETVAPERGTAEGGDAAAREVA